MNRMLIYKKNLIFILTAVIVILLTGTSCTHKKESSISSMIPSSSQTKSKFNINTLWQKCFGGSGIDASLSIALSQDNGYVFAGHTTSNDGDVSGAKGSYDAWIVKLDEQGSIEWQRRIGGSGEDSFQAIYSTKDGGFITAGYTESNDGDISDNHGYYDVLVVKLNDQGETQWQRCYGGSNWDEAYDIIQTSDGGYAFAGYTWSQDGDALGNKGRSGWIVKLDSKGDIQWQRFFGGIRGDYFSSIRETIDGGYIAAGETRSFDVENDDEKKGLNAWIVKLDSQGETEWIKSYGGSHWDAAYSIRQTADKGYIVAGIAGSNDGDVKGHKGKWNTWVLKLDSSGEIQWQKCYGGSENDGARVIEITKAGGYILGGWGNSADNNMLQNKEEMYAWLVKIDDRGKIEGQKFFGGSGQDAISSLKQIGENSFIVTGWTKSQHGTFGRLKGITDAFVMKIEYLPND